jgi:hypothetical protein
VYNRYPHPRLYEAYEDAIGFSTPAAIHEMNAAAQRWPQEWIIDALQRAAADQRPSWRYAKAILQRREGG